MSFCCRYTALCNYEHLPSQPLYSQTYVHLVQDGFSEFVSRCEGADFEDANMAHQGKMSLRDLQKMRQNPGLAYATKPASELAMDNREVWQVWPSESAAPMIAAPLPNAVSAGRSSVAATVFPASSQMSVLRIWPN